MEGVRGEVTICKQMRENCLFRLTTQKDNCAGERGLSVEWRNWKAFVAIGACLS